VKEEWEDVDEYEGLYQVSSLGRVKSFQRYPIVGRILKPAHNRDGYLQVVLSRNRRHRTMLVHRLVAEAFLPRSPGQDEVNHKNGIKDDNRKSNLEWATHRQNCRHADEILGTMPHGEANGSATLTRRQVRQIRRLDANGKHSHRELAEVFGVDRSTVSKIVRRDAWKHIP
jgi:hypothetical protein